MASAPALEWLGAISPEDRASIFSYCGARSQTRLALCSVFANCLAADDEGDAALVSQQLRRYCSIDTMREIDTTHLKVVLRAGKHITSDMLSSLKDQKPVTMRTYAVDSTERKHMSLNL